MVRFSAILASALVLTLAAPAAAQQQEPEARGLDAVCPQPMEPAGFTDIGGNVHERAINCLAEYGVTAGVTPTTYEPSGLVRRDQMASFIARFLQLVFAVELPDDPPAPFADVAPDNPHARAINQLAEIGVVGGHGDGTYRPAAPVRRDQMTAFLNRAHAEVMGEPQTSDEVFFTDVEGNPHAPDINGLAGNGVVTGFGDGTFRPASPVRRDQMASFVMRQADAIAIHAVTSTFRVRMLGELEVDDDGAFGQGEPGAWGGAVFQLHAPSGRVCYQILATVSSPFTGVHIHAGRMHENGPVTVALEDPDPDTGRASGCTFADPDDVQAIENDPTGFYLNVHTEDHPDGALRGQLRTDVYETYLSWAFELDDGEGGPELGQGTPGEDGRAYVQVDPLRGELCAYLVVTTADDSADLTIRQGGMDERGPAVVDLEPADSQGRSSTCEAAPSGIDDPAGFYVSVDGRMRGQLGAFALVVPLSAEEAPDGGEPGASGEFFVQYRLDGVACHLLVTDATGPHTSVDLLRDGQIVHEFTALPGGCDQLAGPAVAGLDFERAAHDLLLRTSEHPDGAVAGPVIAGSPW